MLHVLLLVVAREAQSQHFNLPTMFVIGSSDEMVVFVKATLLQLFMSGVHSVDGLMEFSFVCEFLVCKIDG